MQDKEARQEYMRKYYEEHKDEFITRQLKRYEDNRDELLAYQNERYVNKREELLEYQKEYAKNNPDVPRRAVLKQHKKRGKRVVNFGQDSINEFYKNCPVGMVVDHIIPLCGRNVSGLHVEWNLQYLTQTENSRKINKFDGTIENNGWRNR